MSSGSRLRATSVRPGVDEGPAGGGSGGARGGGFDYERLLRARATPRRPVQRIGRGGAHQPAGADDEAACSPVVTDRPLAACGEPIARARFGPTRLRQLPLSHPLNLR
jgi:hypothetical protein